MKGEAMRIFITLGMAVALINCSAANKDRDQQQSTSGAATDAAPKIDPDKIEVRFQIAKASLPATLTAGPLAKDQAARTPIMGKDLAALAGAIKDRVPIGTVGPKCFRVCETQCFGIGENQTCVPQCHIECID
jgi:hypothetical protein